MGYKMKGPSMYKDKLTVNRNGYASKPDGRAKSSMAQKEVHSMFYQNKPGAPDMKTGKYEHSFEKGGAPKTGAFIFDVDKETGKETSKRATYKDTREAEKKGKKVVYTNKEDRKRNEEEIRNLEKSAKKATSEGKHDKAKGKKALVEAQKKSMQYKKEYVKKHKNTPEDKQKRNEDAAFQAQIERDAKVKEKKKKGDKTNTKPISRDYRVIVKDNKTRKDKIDENKPGDSGTKTTIGRKNTSYEKA